MHSIHTKHKCIEIQNCIIPKYKNSIPTKYKHKAHMHGQTDGHTDGYI